MNLWVFTKLLILAFIGLEGSGEGNEIRKEGRLVGAINYPIPCAPTDLHSSTAQELTNASPGYKGAWTAVHGSPNHQAHSCLSFSTTHTER